MMCRASRRLISSTSAAIVVVLPEPVAPPISTSPRVERRERLDFGGRRARTSCGHARGSTRMAAAARPRSRCRLTRKRPSAGMRSDASAMPRLLITAASHATAAAAPPPPRCRCRRARDPASEARRRPRAWLAALPATSSRSLPRRSTTCCQQRLDAQNRRRRLSRRSSTRSVP